MRLLLPALLLASTLPAQTISFGREIRPILSDRCFQCHGPDRAHRKAGLRLDVRDSAIAIRKGRTAIVPGAPEKSELVARITAADPKDRMPPRKTHKTLSTAEIALLTEWVREGAPYEAHWSYQPLAELALPEGAAANRIDRFVQADLATRGIEPSPEADPVTLIRRVSFDLTGVPPTPAEVDAFVADARPDAYERLVDRLLASPRYGERLAMYWLDLVRFADTVGYHGDQEHSIAPYRDYVIEAFNSNMPFDRFTVEQLAGDLLPAPTEQQRVATGYNRVLQTTHEGGAQAKEYLAIYAADRVRNFASVWLGGTLGCAQCHDHKYDPYTAHDFYAMAAFFADIQELGDFKGSPNTSPTTRPPELLLLPAEHRPALARLDAALVTARAELRKAKKGKPQQAARATVRKLEAERRAVAAKGRRTMITVAQAPRPTRLLARGDWMDESGPIVQPAVPHFLPQIAKAERATRLDLARWVTTGTRALTARVFVNRLFYLFFGRGLSPTLDDLGAQGQPPTHPELLEDTANAFIQSGWDVRATIRQIVTSATYRQSSVPRPDAGPQGAVRLARQSRWRLPAEMIRDNALAIAGLLVESVGGDSVKPYQPTGYYRHMNFPRRKYQHHTDARQWRRGVYMHWQRMFLHPALKAFDAPTREECTAQRPVSNAPQAALTLLNDPTFVEAARVFAARLLDSGAASDEERIQRGFVLATSRPPRPAEVRVLQEVLDGHRRDYARDEAAATALLGTGQAPVHDAHAPAELAAWTAVARVLLNLHETTTRN